MSTVCVQSDMICINDKLAICVPVKSVTNQDRNNTKKYKISDCLTDTQIHFLMILILKETCFLPNEYIIHFSVIPCTFSNQFFCTSYLLDSFQYNLCFLFLYAITYLRNTFPIIKDLFCSITSFRLDILDGFGINLIKPIDKECKPFSKNCMENVKQTFQVSSNILD